MASVWFNSPLDGNTVSPTFSVSVGWDVTEFIKPAAKSADNGGLQITLAASGATISPPNPVTITGATGCVTFSVAAPIPSQPTSLLLSVTLSGVVGANPSAEETVIVNGSGSGIIVLPAPPPPSPDQKPKPKAATDCPPPVVFNGTVPNDPTDPTTGLVVQIYRVVEGELFVDYLAIAQMLGSSLVDASDGSIRAGNTFWVVFPADARTENRQYQFSLLGVLGKVIVTSSGPVT